MDRFIMQDDVQRLVELANEAYGACGLTQRAMAEQLEGPTGGQVQQGHISRVLRGSGPDFERTPEWVSQMLVRIINKFHPSVYLSAAWKVQKK